LKLQSTKSRFPTENGEQLLALQGDVVPKAQYDKRRADLVATALHGRISNL